MTKKTWIKIKHGLLEPKHREQMGKAIWLYLYILDICDWDTGAIPDWRDEDVAKVLNMNLTSLRRMRRKLEEEEYIKCEQMRDSQVIYITNWTNPREYSGKVYNKPETEGVQKRPPKGSIEVTTPSYNPHLKESQVKEGTLPRKRDYRLDHPAILEYRTVAHLYVPIVWRDRVIEAVGDKEESVLSWHTLVDDWIGYGWNKSNIKGMIEAYKNGGISRKPSGNDAALDAAMQEVFGGN